MSQAHPDGERGKYHLWLFIAINPPGYRPSNGLLNLHKCLRHCCVHVMEVFTSRWKMPTLWSRLDCWVCPKGNHQAACMPSEGVVREGGRDFLFSFLLIGGQDIMHLKLKCKGSYKMAVLCCSAIPEEKYYIKKTDSFQAPSSHCVCVCFVFH